MAFIPHVHPKSFTIDEISNMSNKSFYAWQIMKLVEIDMFNIYIYCAFDISVRSTKK